MDNIVNRVSHLSLSIYIDLSHVVVVVVVAVVVVAVVVVMDVSHHVVPLVANEIYTIGVNQISYHTSNSQLPSHKFV